MIMYIIGGWKVFDIWLPLFGELDLVHNIVIFFLELVIDEY